MPKFRYRSNVKLGQSYVWLRDITCRDGSILKKGTIATVVGMTFEPFKGELDVCDFNWIIAASNGTNTWSTFEGCVTRKMCELVDWTVKFVDEGRSVR